MCLRERLVAYFKGFCHNLPWVGVKTIKIHGFSEINFELMLLESSTLVKNKDKNVMSDKGARCIFWSLQSHFDPK